VPEVLAALADRASLALLTNKPLDATREILDGLDLARFFGTAVIGGDGPFARKPDPAGLLHLVSAAGRAADETLMVGDSPIDWRTARAASTALCLARYGFGFEGFSAASLGPADTVVDAAAELLRL
jgi:phosphoglycolate phosphatase